MRINVNRPLHTILIAAILASTVLLGGCASAGKGSKSNTMFDFGSPAPAQAAARAPAQGDPAQGDPAPLPALVVSDATGTPPLDSERMFYRLAYADPMQARSYANSRWSSSPLQMVTQRFKARIGQAGVKVLSITDAAVGVPILRIDVDDFIHTFDSATHSSGQLVLRASVFQGHTLVDQKTFSRSVPAASADAAGGARALADCTDAVAADILAWLATLDLRKR